MDQRWTPLSSSTAPHLTPHLSPRILTRLTLTLTVTLTLTLTLTLLPHTHTPPPPSSLPRNGYDLEGEGLRHAETPELAREVLRESAALIFKTQIEVAFREQTAGHNALVLFAYLALGMMAGGGGGSRGGGGGEMSGGGC